MMIANLVKITKIFIYKNINTIIISLFFSSFIFSFLISFLSPSSLRSLIREENLIEIGSGFFWLLSSIVFFFTCFKYQFNRIYNFFGGIISIIAFSDEMNFITIISEKISNKQISIPKFMKIIYYCTFSECNFPKQIWSTLLIMIFLVFFIKNYRKKVKNFFFRLIKMIQSKFVAKLFFASIAFIILGLIIDLNILNLKGDVYYITVLIEETIELYASFLIFISSLYSYDKFDFKFQKSSNYF